MENSGQDITERRQAEEKSQLSYEMLEAILHLSQGEGIIVLQDEGEREGVQIFCCNDVWPTITGYPEGELLHMSLFDLVHPRDREAFLTRYRSKEERSTPQTLEVTIIRKDGSEVPVEATCVWSTDRGKPVSIVYIRDITERKRREQQGIDLIQELEATVGELSSFAYTVAHDLRGPLVTIEGWGRQLRTDLEKKQMEGVRQDLQLIESGISKMQRLLNVVLEYSRVGKVVQPTENVPFKEIVEETLELLDGPIKASNVTISLPDTFPTVYADPVRMAQVLTNLIQNSIDYRDEGRAPTIEIGYWASNGEVVLFVHDNGKGIAPQEQERIFELFYRGSSSSQGIGAGLAISRNIVAAHGGRMWLESEVGQGTTIYFSLPATPGGRAPRPSINSLSCPLASSRLA